MPLVRERTALGRATVAFNFTVGVAGLATGRTDLLRLMTVDALHEPYRAAAYPQLPRLVQAARDAGFAMPLRKAPAIDSQSSDPFNTLFGSLSQLDVGVTTHSRSSSRSARSRWRRRVRTTV